MKNLTVQEIKMIKQEAKCTKCGHACHCNKECMECANDVCTGCTCENSEGIR